MPARGDGGRRPPVPPVPAAYHELADRDGEAWLAPFKPLGNCSFERGLVYLDVRGRDLLSANFAELLATEAFAWVIGFGLMLEDDSPSVRNRALSSPHLGRVPDLLLGAEELTDAQVRRLAASPHLAGLLNLDLCENSFGARGVTALAQSPHLTGLRSLDLSSIEVGEAGARALAEGPLLGRLHILDLFECGLGPAEAHALAAFPGPGGPRQLQLTFNPLGWEGIAALAISPLLAACERLDLGFTRLGPAGAWPLATSARLARVVHLTLSGNDLGDDGAAALSGAAGLGSLVASICPTTRSARPAQRPWLARALAGHRSATSSLDGNPVSPNGAGALAGPARLGSLSQVVVAENGAGRRGGCRAGRRARSGRPRGSRPDPEPDRPRWPQALLASPGLAGLRRLVLNGNPLGPEGRDGPGPRQPARRAAPAQPGSVQAGARRGERTGEGAPAYPGRTSRPG